MMNIEAKGKPRKAFDFYLYQIDFARLVQTLKLPCLICLVHVLKALCAAFHSLLTNIKLLYEVKQKVYLPYQN